MNPHTDHTKADHTVTKETSSMPKPRRFFGIPSFFSHLPRSEDAHGQAGQGRREAGKGSVHQRVTCRRLTEDTGMRRAMGILSTVGVVAVVAGASLAATPAQAATTAPWWHLTSSAVPTNLPPAGRGQIVVAASNLGDAAVDGEATPVTIVDYLPSGLTPLAIEAVAGLGLGGTDEDGPVSCELASLTCTFEGTLPPYDQIEVVIGVEVEHGASSGELNRVDVTGGGAEASSLARPITVSANPTPFGLQDNELTLETAAGPATGQFAAGSHPFQVTNTLVTNQRFVPGSEEVLSKEPGVRRAFPAPAALPHSLTVNLPAGLVGNPKPFSRCNLQQFTTYVSGFANACPASSAVGVATVLVFEPSVKIPARFVLPIFNLEPSLGEPARFGFYIPFTQTPVEIDASLRGGPDTGEEYAVTVATMNVPQTVALTAAELTFWGVPGDPRHDNSHGSGCLHATRFGTGTCQPSEAPSPPAFLTLPTSCSEAPLQSTTELDSWLASSEPLTLATSPPLPVLDGCSRLAFNPAIEAQPTAHSAASPSGLEFDLNFNDEGLISPEGLAESHLKQAVVALPGGVTTNPAVASGLTSCTEAQYREESLVSEALGCPESSKIGEVELESPLVEPIFHGSIYVAKQGHNPNHNLLTIYMVARSPQLGIIIRAAGEVVPSPSNGQLTTTFKELPQLPFSHFHLSFRQGQRAPLITPGLCGAYHTQAQLFPYSNPGAPVERTATFTVNSGANGQPCATQESQLPNKPSLESGTLTPIAGAYSPFVFKVKREDGSQVLSRIDATLPEGLLGKLAGLTECSNAQIAQAESRGGEGQGALELASPSCPASSQVGVVNVGAGVGTQPYYVQGKDYLAGPYKGARLSLAIITPAVIGPFDLGTIVVRTALYVNETTAQITAKSDPIPTIVHGLPTVVQSIALNMSRTNFTLNPTSCETMQITGSATSILDSTAALRQRFQVGGCGALAFAPKLKLRLEGSVRRTANPKLIANLRARPGEANIARAQVKLPSSAFLDQGHIGGVCTKVIFAEGANLGEKCPANSIYGKAIAKSPLLDRPLQGNVYLRSPQAGHKLPDLVAALNGQIEVALVGKTDSVKGALRNTFEAVPDAPVSSFRLELFGGRRGLIEMSTGFCRSPRASVKLTAHNGKAYDTNPVVRSDCPRGR